MNDDSKRRVHPKGHCQSCGEPLRFVPCLNCSALRELKEADEE
ncbi:hypothetical protein [Natronococcus wangiae]|nr:hypothetical protein [Natronococcus sp. AD5]